MKIAVNGLANIIGYTYLSVAALVAMPMYLAMFDQNSFGLIGFYTLAVTWANLLDLGLSPTIGRQFAILRQNKNELKSTFQILNSFETIFFILAVFLLLLVYHYGDFIFRNWLTNSNDNRKDISTSILLIGVTMSLRWFKSLYSSVCNGYEDQVWVNAINIIFATIRYFGVLIFLQIFGINILTFFIYQIATLVIEIIIFHIHIYNRLTRLEKVKRVIFSWGKVKPVLPFAFNTAYTSILFMVITQIDKFALSRILSLEEFGFFSLVVVISGGVLNLNSALAMPITPRLSYLYSQKNIIQMEKIYSIGTQIQVLVAVSVGVTIAINAADLILAWTGSQEVADWSAEILFWYSLGGIGMILATIPLGLQVAYGKMGLAATGTTINALLSIPVIVWFAIQYGALGAAVSWCFTRIIWGVIWIAIVHSKFMPKKHLHWLVHDVAPSVIFPIFIAFGLDHVLIIQEQIAHSSMLLLIFIKILLQLVLAMFSSRFLRSYIFENFKLYLCQKSQ